MKNIESRILAWTEDNHIGVDNFECYEAKSTLDMMEELEKRINELKATLELARSHIGGALVDLTGDGNNFVTIKSVIDEVLAGEK